MSESYRKFYKNKRILITGGLGFIGSTLANQLASYGSKVTIIDNLAPDMGANFFNIKTIRNKIKINIADIRDELAMNYLIKNQEIIFNVAGNPSHLESMTDPIIDYETNIRGQQCLLESCRNFNNTTKIVYVGSRAQYGSIKDNPFNEDVLMLPKDIYGANKMAAEFLHFFYGRYFGIKATSIRMGPGYGPRCHMKHAKYGVLNFLLRKNMEGEVLTIFGDGKQFRDSIYIDDAVEAMLMAGASDKSNGEAYNIGSGIPKTFKEQVELIIKACGFGKSKHVPWPSDRKKIEVGDSIADILKIKRHLGWVPKTQMETGMKKTYLYYKNNKENYW